MYGIQSQERRYYYSGIAVPVCWNGGAIPTGIFIHFEYKNSGKRKYSTKKASIHIISLAKRLQNTMRYNPENRVGVRQLCHEAVIG